MPRKRKNKDSDYSEEGEGEDEASGRKSEPEQPINHYQKKA